MSEANGLLLIYAVTSLCLFAIGVYGFIVGPQLLRRILALNVMGAGIFMFMVTLAYRGVTGSADAVLHALVLTGLVVAVSATAFALALLSRLKQASHKQQGAD